MFKFFAKKTAGNKEFKIWTNQNHPEEIVNYDFLVSKLSFIHNNPVRARIVELPKDYIYSSASNYVGDKGIIDVILML